MKKIKLITPILGIATLSSAIIPLVGCSCRSKEETLKEVDHDTWIEKYTSFIANYEASTTRYKTVKIGGNKIYNGSVLNRPCLMDYREIGYLKEGKKYALIDDFFGENVMPFGGIDTNIIVQMIELWVDKEASFYKDMKYYVSDTKVELKATVKQQPKNAQISDLHFVCDKNGYLTQATFVLGSSDQYDCSLEYSNDSCDSLTAMQQYDQLFDNTNLPKDKYTSGVKVTGWVKQNLQPKVEFSNCDASMEYIQTGTTGKYFAKGNIEVSGNGSYTFELGGFDKYSASEESSVTKIMSLVSKAETWAQLDSEIQVTYKCSATDGFSIEAKKGSEIVYKLQLNKDLYLTYEFSQGKAGQQERTYEITVTYQ